MESPKKSQSLEDLPQVTSNTVFSQQRIVAWRPLFTPYCTSAILLVMGALMIVLGALLYVYLGKLPQYDIRYDDKCQENSTCGIILTIPENLTGNIFIHYKLTNFFQNHRRYLFSRNDKQLRGEYIQYAGLTECGDYRSINGSEDPTNLLLPSGAVAYSLFNDTFTWENKSVANFTDAGISWRSDRDKLFKRLSPEYKVGYKWLDKRNETFPNGQRNEHFIVWMRTAALPTFYKTYSKCIDCVIPAGDYTITIQNNYPVSAFKGEKHLVISKVLTLGGKNTFIGLSYIIVGSILFLFGIVVLISQIYCPRVLGDTSVLRKL